MRGQIGFVAIDGFDELANDVFTELEEKNGGILVETSMSSSRPTSSKYIYSLTVNF